MNRGRKAVAAATALQGTFEKAANQVSLIYNERRQGAETETLAHVPEGQKESSASV